MTVILPPKGTQVNGDGMTLGEDKTTPGEGEGGPGKDAALGVSVNFRAARMACLRHKKLDPFISKNRGSNASSWGEGGDDKGMGTPLCVSFEYSN